jgi:hypothetical protein
LLLLAVVLARTLIQQQLALCFLCRIDTASCQRRLARILSWDAAHTRHLQRVWCRAVIRGFAPGRGRLTLVMDWTLHRDRCRSLWIMLPVGGRAVPMVFWLAPPEMGGEGSQRALEDRAVLELRSWLGQRRVLLIGDRGFRGRDRMRFLEKHQFQFILRVTGDTQIKVGRKWLALQEVAPPLGKRRHFEQVLFGKEGPAAERIRVNLVAVHQPLLAPRPERTNKGKKSGQQRDETVWYLATNLPLGTDAAALYRQRMQIEETFRDLKALLGMEQERTKEPWKRLVPLMWALMIGEALALHAGGVGEQPLPRPPRCRRDATEAPGPKQPEYRRESATREGLHRLVVDLILGDSPLREELQAIAAKSERMKQRPQVKGRRRTTPALHRRTSRSSSIHSHA